jgi:HEAT repeat protein
MAMRAFAKVADAHSFRYLRFLTQQLVRVSDSAYRLDCLKALIQIGGTAAVADVVAVSAALRPHERRASESAIEALGLRTVPLLLTLTKNTTLVDHSRILAVRILSRLALPQLRANLQEVLDQEIERAYFYYTHSHFLKTSIEYASIDLRILLETLTTSYRQVVAFIIYLLGEAGQVEDSELLVRSLTSRHAKVRSQAFETLAKSCSRTTFKQLYPLVTDLPASEKLRASQRWYSHPLPLESVLERMSGSSSMLERLVAAMYQKELQQPAWRTTLRRQMQDGDETFINLAYELLEE